MNMLKRFVTGLGNQTAPFGFSPEDPNAGYKAGLGYIGDIGANLLANNQGGVDPFANLGASLQQAKASGTQRNKEQYTAQRLMEEAQLKRQEREKAAAEEAQREEFLKSLPPDVQMKARSVPGFLEAYVEATDPNLQKPEQPKLYTVDGALVDANGNVVYQGQGGGGGPGSADLGLNLVPLADKDGNFVGWGQPSKGGGIYPAQIQGGEDVRPMSPFERKLSESSGAAQGSAEGEAVAGASGDIAAADVALRKINELREDPNRSWGTGVSSVFNVIPGTPGYDYQTKVDEVTAGAFLTAIQQMRGLGQLSNVEGQTAKQAVTRMKTATSEGEFLDALNDYEEIVTAGKQRAQNRLQKATGSKPSDGGQRTRYKFNAETGELE